MGETFLIGLGGFVILFWNLSLIGFTWWLVDPLVEKTTSLYTYIWFFGVLALLDILALERTGTASRQEGKKCISFLLILYAT